MSQRIQIIWIFAITACFQVSRVQGHGRLIEPPSRSTMWRYGFDTPPNYNDHELYCGGFSRMWRTNGGKCGICGDPWDVAPPRPNEAGGLYGRGVIVRKYLKNSVIRVRVELTANHMGYFEFRMCPNNNRKKPATQACLDQYVLQNANTGDERYYPGPGTKVFEMQMQLPKDLTCKQCVFQWRYVAGNNWGMCKNGTGAVGCGPQEQFRACADVSITEDDGSADSTPNDLEDNEVYAPINLDYEDEKSNEVDFYEKNDHDEYEVRVESAIFIVIGTLLGVALFFGLLFFYYTRGKKYVEDIEWDMPSLPSMPKMPDINWPLSKIHLKNLPAQFLKRRSGEKKEDRAPPTATPRKTVSAPINVVSSTNEAATGPPTAPPRTYQHGRKGRPAPPVPPPKVATISGRPHPPRSHVLSAQFEPSPHQYHHHDHSTMVSVPLNNDDDTSGDDRSSVTVNGVTVRSTAINGSISSSNGGVAWVTPAMADENIPDSLEQQSSIASSSEIPPPPPSCPPPELTDSEA